MIFRYAFSPVILASVLATCDPGSGEGEDGRIPLPRPLTEISGLAQASDTSVFAHDDERAFIHELRISDGAFLRTFQLGQSGVAGDFEGVAVVDDLIFLVTSTGQIYSSVIGEDRDRVEFTVFDSGVGEYCEIEGLSEAPDADFLLILCKEMRNKTDRGQLMIFRWKIGGERADQEPWLSLPLEELLDGGKTRNFRPSALEWDAQNKRLWIASARSRELLVLSKDGVLIDRRKLDKERHPQVEGLTLLPDGQLVLADERANASSAYLTIYPGLPPED